MSETRTAGSNEQAIREDQTRRVVAWLRGRTGDEPDLVDDLLHDLGMEAADFLIPTELRGQG